MCDIKYILITPDGYEESFDFRDEAIKVAKTIEGAIVKAVEVCCDEFGCTETNEEEIVFENKPEEVVIPEDQLISKDDILNNEVFEEGKLIDKIKEKQQERKQKRFIKKFEKENQPKTEDEPEWGDEEKWNEEHHSVKLDEKLSSTQVAEFRKNHFFDFLDDFELGKIVHLYTRFMEDDDVYLKDSEVKQDELQQFIEDVGGWGLFAIDCSEFEDSGLSNSLTLKLVKTDEKLVKACEKLALCGNNSLNILGYHINRTYEPTTNIWSYEPKITAENIEDLSIRKCFPSERDMRDVLKNNIKNLSKLYWDDDKLLEFDAAKYLEKDNAELSAFNNKQLLKYKDELDEIEIPFDKIDNSEAYSLDEETHAKVAQPEVDNIKAFNSALKIAKENNKPVIYGYMGSDHHGDYRYYEIEPVICDDLAKCTDDVMKKYHPAGSVLVAYPDKAFRESLLVVEIPDELYENPFECEFPGCYDAEELADCEECGEDSPVELCPHCGREICECGTLQEECNCEKKESHFKKDAEYDIDKMVEDLEKYEESLEETVPEDLTDDRTPVIEKEEILDEPIDATEIRKHEKAIEEEKEITEYYNREATAEPGQEYPEPDNAIVPCEKYTLVAHSEDEKPLDCKMEKKPLEKPLTEEK